MSKIVSYIIIPTVLILSAGATQATAAVNTSFNRGVETKKSIKKKTLNRTQRIEKAIRDTFGHKYDDTALCIAVMESSGPDRFNREWRPGMELRFDTDAWSPTGDHGIFQGNYLSHRWPGESEVAFHKRMSRTWYAIQWAWKLSREGTNFSPWTGTYGRGMCRGLS
jgi:hypothetical protein